MAPSSSIFRICYHHSKHFKSLRTRYKQFPALSSSAVVDRCKRSSDNPGRSTIYALSTGSGMAAIAVVRVSGPNASSVFYKIGRLKSLPDARKATLCGLNDPESGELLDKALTLWFPSPHSFTGEDLCELHIHGGIAVIKSVLNALQKLPHFRFAEPGEFTKRAFMAGKLDLTRVEGLADLLHAETEAQQKQALRQMDGALHKLYTDWTGRVKKCLARLEAYIDFSEDQHLEDTILSSVKVDLEALKSEISDHLLDKRKGQKLRNGVFTVLIGQPNVGKSSLLNSLCKRDIAIVSSTAGTTRDVIESSLNLGGYLVNICDTAGIRDTGNSIEQEGVRRAKERSSQADVLILIAEAKKVLSFIESHNIRQEELLSRLLCEELGDSFLDKTYSLDSVTGTNIHNLSSTILLLNKIDLLTREELQKVKQLKNGDFSVSAVSCTDGTGMNDFVDLFADKVKEICCGHRGEEPTITQERHRQCVQNCLRNISEYEDCLDIDIAIATDKLRSAVNELGKITGKISTNDILDVIFQDFCIGK